ncbi:PAIRB-like protein [Mya arenaria]|uniref:PAIRB-like protein n=1 Tax=Mya arenaria TaxID=6604 RepID=A0ABY7FR83_MYAAR|nr:PAIRB-like protein [Mya arenaria]
MIKTQIDTLNTCLLVTANVLFHFYQCSNLTSLEKVSTAPRLNDRPRTGGRPNREPREPREDNRPPRRREENANQNTERSERVSSGFQRPERTEGGGFAQRDDGPRDGFGRGMRGGRGRGTRGGRGRGGFGGKREFERHSGSDRTSGVKPTEKREGSGSHNWGTVKDDIDWRADDQVLYALNHLENIFVLNARKNGYLFLAASHQSSVACWSIVSVLHASFIYELYDKCDNVGVPMTDNDLSGMPKPTSIKRFC